MCTQFGNTSPVQSRSITSDSARSAKVKQFLAFKTSVVLPLGCVHPAEAVQLQQWREVYTYKPSR